MSTSFQNSSFLSSDGEEAAERKEYSISGSIDFSDEDDTTHERPPEDATTTPGNDKSRDVDVQECIRTPLGPTEVEGYKAYSSGRTTPVMTGHAVNIIMAAVDDPEVGIAETVPQYVQRNAIFLIKRTALANAEDVLCDGNGQWEMAYGGKKCLSKFSFSEDFDSWIPASAEEEGLVFRRRAAKNLSKETYHRVVIDCVKADLILVQYYFKNGAEEPFKVKPHGNHKADKPYRRLYPSTRQKITDCLGKGMAPREIPHKLITQIGGVASLDSTAQLPSLKAIHNASAQMKPSKNEDFNRLTLECIEHEDKPTAFVREVVTAPSFLVMLATNEQLDDLVRFAAVKEGGGFSIDTTFNVGDYLVTVITYRYKLVVTEGTEVHPVVLGPVFLHKRKNKPTYQRMASVLLNARPALSNVSVIGTDADEALYDGFQRIFEKAEHILCLFHFTDNMVSKLSQFGMRNCKKDVLDAVLGTKLGSERLSGYIDCETAEDYAAADEALSTKFTNMHENGHMLAEYFTKHKAPAIQKHYSVAAQKQAGVHGQHYTQNPAESMNALIKLGKSKPRSAPVFAFDLEKIARSQSEQFELTLLGQGKYVLIPSYCHLKVSFKNWVAKSAEQRNAIFKRIHLEKYDPSKKAPDTIVLDEKEPTHHARLQSDENGRKLLSVTSVSHDVLADLLDKARIVLNVTYAVSHAVNTSDPVYYVAGAAPGSMSKVTFNEESGAVRCESSCRYYIAFGVCTEALVLAIHLEKLDSYVNWLNSKHGPSANKFGLHKLVDTTGPHNAGSKQHGTSRRKGGPARGIPVSSVFDASLNLPTGITPSSQTSIILRNKRTIADVSVSSVGIPSYSATLHRSALWERILIGDEGQNPSPGPGEYEVWFLSDCPALTKKCSGCGQEFRKKSKDGTVPPKMPNDLVMVTLGTRKYKRLEQVRESRSNVYLHAYRPCVVLAAIGWKQPRFKKLRFPRVTQRNLGCTTVMKNVCGVRCSDGNLWQCSPLTVPRRCFFWFNNFGQ